MKNGKIKVTQCTLSTHTHQFRFWKDGVFLGMKEVFMGIYIKVYAA